MTLMLPITLLAVFGFQSQTESGFQSVSPAEFQDAMENDRDVVVLDVRTKKEFDQGYIEGAVLIDFFDKQFGDRLKALDKDKTYLVYCRSGRRSANAAGQLAALGFRDVVNLKGGILAWQADKREVVQAQKETGKRDAGD